MRVEQVYLANVTVVSGISVVTEKQLPRRGPVDLTHHIDISYIFKIKI